MREEMQGRVTPDGPADLLIVGASARAAAASAVAAGFRVVAADRYQDVDLVKLCPTHKIDRYEVDLLRVADTRACRYWMYLGALENHPAALNALAGRLPLLGVSADQVRLVRSAPHVARALAQEGIPFPRTRQSPRDVPQDGSWLRKPQASCGGVAIEPWFGTLHTDTNRSSREWYYQQRAAGLPCAGLYVAFSDETRLLGVTQQLLGQTWCGVRGFRYCGSIGPLALTGTQEQRWRRLGSVVAARFGLRGVFGIDAMMERDEVLPIEINPRYTASAEVVERATGQSVLGAHVAACVPTDKWLDTWALCAVPPLGGGAANDYGIQSPGTVVAGKAIVYATASITIRDSWVGHWLQLPDDARGPQVADIPAPGTQIAVGHPIATVLADGNRLEDVRERLQARAENLYGCVE